MKRVIPSRLFAPWVLLLVLAASASACREAPSVFIEAKFDEAWEVDRLSFVLIPEDGVPLGELTRPEQPQGALSSPQSLRVLLPESSAGKVVSLTIVAWSGETERNRRTVRFSVPESGEARANVDFTAAPGQGGGDGCEGGVCTCAEGTACAEGQRCLDGVCVCDAESCPNGCCDGDTCRARSTGACGAAGEPCFDCGMRANNCGPGGSCQCGTAGPCQTGQRCLGGQCVCDETSCAGCCLGQTCEAGTHPDACGAGGIECKPCPTGDSCDSGSCSSCNETTCPDGCCQGADCVARGPETCAPVAQACTTCNPLIADTCGEDGNCACGSGAACATGQQCVSGECLCTAESCDGCCDGNACLAGTQDEACGTGGTACGGCPGGYSCQSGACRCGLSTSCTGRCVMGICLG